MSREAAVPTVRRNEDQERCASCYNVSKCNGLTLGLSLSSFVERLSSIIWRLLCTEFRCPLLRLSSFASLPWLQYRPWDSTDIWSVVILLFFSFVS